MPSLVLPPPGTYDCLYVSPHPEVAARSCAARIAWEAERGHRILIAVVFGDAPGTLPAGSQGIACGLPDAPARHGAYASLRARLEDRQPEDEETLERAAALFDDLGRKSGARHVYAPLGVGESIDHRLSHEAALRVFHAGAGRNVFLYEEQPQASVPGAVRVRLASVGAQLPPGAAASAARAGLLRFLFRLQLAPQMRREARGIAERFACARTAARQWNAARGWRPLRAFGPRLQPVDEAVAPQGTQRFWLLLPEREPAGVGVVPASALRRTTSVPQ